MTRLEEVNAAVSLVRHLETHAIQGLPERLSARYRDGIARTMVALKDMQQYAAILDGVVKSVAPKPLACEPSLKELCRRAGANYDRVRRLIERGETPEDAIRDAPREATKRRIRSTGTSLRLLSEPLDARGVAVGTEPVLGKTNRK
jgi:hypothetical protein